MQWHYAENGKSVGPLSDQEFQALVNTGKITASTLVWKAGMKTWAAYSTVAVPSGSQAPSEAPAAGPGQCCECKRTFPQEDLISYEGVTVCAACKPLFFQRVQEGAALPGTVVYGGFWIRVAAKFVDGIILWVVNMVVSMVFTFAFVTAAVKAATTGSDTQAAVKVIILQVILMFIQIALSGIYYVLFLGKYGATPGKMACKLKVVRADGSKITYGRAIGRFFGDMLSSLILGIGYIMVGFDSEKRALHDRLCDTRVIKIG